MRRYVTLLLFVFALPSYSFNLSKFCGLFLGTAGKHFLAAPQELVGPAKYYHESGSDYWATYVEANPGSYIGNTKAKRVVLPGGSTAVMRQSTTRKGLEEMVSLLERWREEGCGVKIKGVGVKERGGDTWFVVLMEDFAAPTNEYGTLRSSGSAYEARKLRELSPETRAWAKERVLGMLDNHSDPHLRNVMFRVTNLAPGAAVPAHQYARVEGDKLIELVKVDPDPMPMQIFQFIQNGGDIRASADPQYNREAQRRYLNSQLSLE